MSSAETVNGIDVGEWQGSAFDPENKRLFSILPECDDDEAYCVRHDREMEAVNVVIKREGGLYMTASGWDVYTCPVCAHNAGKAGKQFFRAAVRWAFETFDDTDEDVLDGAFEYIAEADEVDIEEVQR